MCGRAYATFSEEELQARYENKRPIRIAKVIKPNYNIAPTQDVLVLRLVDGIYQLDPLRWQFVAPWEKEFKTKLSTINAKSETIFESRMYKNAITTRRCIVPLSGFFEWKRAGDHKTPFAIHATSDGASSGANHGTSPGTAKQRGPSPILSVAGIWSAWRDPASKDESGHGPGEGDGTERISFAILTVAANKFMRHIHDRMPVILAAEDENAWLDPATQSKSKLEKLMRPCPDRWLAAHEISTLVNSPRNNTPAVLEPS